MISFIDRLCEVTFDFDFLVLYSSFEFVTCEGTKG